jgi:hypothetical protein
LNSSIDILVLAAYPIDIYEEIIEYSKDFNYKILSDLPISFHPEILLKHIGNKQVHLFLQETYLSFFRKISLLNNNIININCLLLQNKNNLLHQEFKRESLIVDTQYMLNNLL